MKSRRVVGGGGGPRTLVASDEGGFVSSSLLGNICFVVCVLLVSFFFACVVIAFQGPSDHALLSLLRLRRLSALKAQTAHFRNRTAQSLLRAQALGSKATDPSSFAKVTVVPATESDYVPGASRHLELVVAGDNIDKVDPMVEVGVVGRVPITLTVFGEPKVNSEGKPRSSPTTTYLYTSLEPTDGDRELGREECPGYISYIVDRYDSLPLYVGFLHSKASPLSPNVFAALSARAKAALVGNKYNLTAGAPSNPPDYFISAEPTSHSPAGLPGYLSLSPMTVFRCVDHVVDDCCKLDGEKMQMIMSLFDKGGDPDDSEYPLGFKTSHAPGCVRAQCCSIFMVHRDRIRRHSKTFWQRLGAFSGHVQGGCWQLEHFWHVVMGELPITGGVPAGIAKKHEQAIGALLGGNPWQNCDVEESVTETAGVCLPARGDALGSCVS